MNDYDYSREVENFDALPLISALEDGISHNWIEFPDNLNHRNSQPRNVNPEESLAFQTRSFLTDGSHVDGWEVRDDLELKTAGETAVIIPWASDFLSGGPLEIAAPSDTLPYTKPVEEYSEDDYGWAEELEAYIFALTNSRTDANSSKRVLKTIPENIKLTLSTNAIISLPNSQARDDVAESTGKPATAATFSVDDCPPGASSYSSVGQVNAAARWTGGPATTTESFAAPPNHGRKPSYLRRSIGQTIVASDTPKYLDQLITMDGVTAPVPHSPLAGLRQSKYEKHPSTAPATVSRHSNAQMGGGSSLYNPVAQATVAPNMNAYAGSSMPIYGTDPPLARAPITLAFPVDERQPPTSPPTMRAQAAHRGTRHDPYKHSSVSKCAPTSSEPEFYFCQWGDCSEGPMNVTQIFEHFLAHGERIKESGRVKECKWAGCDPKRGAFPISCDGWRRHVYETQSHAGIGVLTKVKCETCGMKRARRSMPSHRRMCSGESKEPEGKGKKKKD